MRQVIGTEGKPRNVPQNILELNVDRGGLLHEGGKDEHFNK